MSHILDQEPLVTAIHKFWFGPLDAEGRTTPDIMQQWFTKNPEFDRTIHKKFGEYVDVAFMGAFDRWIKSDTALVALIVLLDQLPRNMFRDTPRSFAYDKKALATMWHAVEGDRYLQMPTLHGYFALMPSMHAENLEVQDFGVKAFAKLLNHAPEAHKPVIASALRYAEAHQAIISRFGRFPHRNAILGRESTAEEVAFLKEPGSSF